MPESSICIFENSQEKPFYTQIQKFEFKVTVQHDLWQNAFSCDPFGKARERGKSNIGYIGIIPELLIFYHEHVHTYFEISIYCMSFMHLF